MALELPTLITLAAPLAVPNNNALPPRYQGEPLALENFPESPLTLPEDSQVFSGTVPAYAAITRRTVVEQSVAYLTQALDHLALKDGRHSPRLLLVLPDKTRSPIAARLLIDSVLTLREQLPGLRFTLLFGLGTHPPMTNREIEHHLGDERYRSLVQHEIPIHQQTTRDPRLPSQNVLVPRSLEMGCSSFATLGQILEQYQARLRQRLATTPPHSLARHLALRELMNALPDHFDPGSDGVVSDPASPPSRPHALMLPQLLWEHHLTIVAGDTDLHPYEGRGGSGGLHKMLTVGLGDLATIRISHSTRILLDPQTRVGGGENGFVRILDQFAACLGDALVDGPDSDARTRPLGFSVLSLQNEEIHGFWWSQRESSRQQLTMVQQNHQTQYLARPLHLVISEAGIGKGTDILAGARSLQYVADWDTPDNCILVDTPHQRVALLFNPCDEEQNHGGIGNSGTKQQLLVLQALGREHRHRLRGELAAVTSMPQGLNVLHHHRRETLGRWLQHLQLVSEMDDFLQVVGDLVKLMQTLMASGQTPVALQDDLQAILAIYSSPYSQEGRAIADLLGALTRGDSLAAIDAKITHLSRHYGQTIGLGAGGQRALRLYRILQKFEALILATTNETVLDFLQQLDPDLSAFLPPAIANQFRDNQISCRLLGIVGINLNEQTCQRAVDCAINYTKFYNPHVSHPQIGFLPKPLILRRC